MLRLLLSWFTSLSLVGGRGRVVKVMCLMSEVDVNDLRKHLTLIEIVNVVKGLRLVRV